MGYAEGHSEGRAEGHAQGLEQGKVEMAISLLNSNMPIEEVVRHSKLSLETIRQLEKKRKNN